MTTNWAERLGAKELRVFKELQKKYEREKQPPEDFPKGFRESDYGKFESLFPEFRVRDMVKRPPVSPGMATRDVFNPFRPQPSMQPQMTSAAQTGTQPFDIKQPISEPMPSQREPFNPFRYNRQEALRGSFQPPDQPLAEIISGQVGESRNIPAEEAIKRITSQPEPGEANWLDRLGEVGDDPAQLIPFVSSVAEFGKLSSVNRAAIALEAGEPVSEIELKLLTEFLNKAQSDKTWGYKVMDVVTQMPAFAGEIAATGGLFTGAKEVTEKAATSALKRLIGSAIERKLPQLLIKGTAGLTAAGIAGVPPAIVRTPAGTQEKQVIGTLTGNDEEVWKSAVKAFGSAWVETASERTGGALGALTDPIKGQMLKSALLRTILRLNPGKTPSQVNSVFQRFGYNGVLGEMFEERVADVGHGVLTGLGLGDEPFKLPSLEQLSVELVSFSVPGVAQRLAEGIPEAAQFAREQPERGAIGGEGVTRDLLARYTERKMSPETGIENDYVTEYRFIKKPENAGAEWMGDEVGIERTLTVGGEVRSRELIETANTRQEAAERLPYETSYIKAEKYGIAKTQFDKATAKKKAEAEVARVEQEKKIEAQGNYEKILREMGTRKDVKRVSVEIVNPEGKKSSVEGLGVGNGIAVAMHGRAIGEGGKYVTYTITHLNTGLSMGGTWKTSREAIAAAKSIAGITDWSKYSSQQSIPKEYITKAKDLLAGFIRKEIEPSVSKVTPTTVKPTTVKPTIAEEVTPEVTPPVSEGVKATRLQTEKDVLGLVKEKGVFTDATGTNWKFTGYSRTKNVSTFESASGQAKFYRIVDDAGNKNDVTIKDILQDQRVTPQPLPEAPQRITQPVSEGVTKSIKQWVGDKVPEIQSLDERTGQIIFKDGTTGELGIDVSDVITLHNINLESKGKGVGTKIFNAIREYADAKQKNIRVSKAYNKGFWTKMGFDIDKLGDYPKIPFRQPSPEAPQAIQRPVSEEVVPEIPVEELREQVKAKLAAQPVVEKAPVVSPAERMAEIQGLLKEPAKNLPAGTTKIALRKELAEINKSLIPQEKKLRSQIMASVKAKSLGVTQSRGIFRDTGGSRYLTNMELTQLEKVFRAIQRARPKKIGGKTVVTEGTEKAIQTLKTNLIQENSLSEQSYKDIMAFLRLKTDKLESPARFIGEREAKELIRTMNFEAEVGLLKHDVEVAKGLEDKPGLAKELKSISNQADETASLTVNKGVKISPWWDMWVYNERLQNRTGEPFYDIYRMMLDKRLANVTKSETIFKDIMDSTPEFNVIATNKESLTKVNNYIASRLGEDVKVVDMSEGEIALAKKIEEVLFSFRNSVRYNRFITTYSANEGDITKMNTDIPNAPRADLIEASRIYESGGAARLTEYLNTKTWGVINTGYEPHIVVNPKLQLRRIKASILPKGMLKTRDGITFDAGEKTILDRTHTYINRMLNLELEPYLRKLDITLQKASPKLREPGKTANDLSLMIDEMKGTFYISEPLARFIAKGGGYASSVVYLAPHLGFRNLFQNAAMYPDRTALVDPRNVKLTQDEQDFFETYVDQSRQFTQQFLLQGELGTGEIANLLRRVSFMGVSEKVNNIWAFWAGVNKGNRALDSYQKTGDVGKFINESGMKDLTLRQQKEVLELMALGKESEAVRLIARKINHNTNMIYDRAQGAPVTMGTSGRLLGSLLNFTRGYGQRLTQQIGKLSPGHTMAEKRHATKILMGLAVFGIAAGTLYQKITGKKQNPYNPLLMLSWSPGGLAVGAMIDAADVIGNIMQAITGDKDALTRIPTDLARSGDLLIPFYGVLLNIIESLSDTKFIDRLVLRKVLALLKKDYKPNEAYYQKERDWVGKLQHALFGGEPAEPIEPDTTNPFREPSSENKNPFRKTTARENPFR